jgi:adenylate cyclase
MKSRHIEEVRTGDRGRIAGRVAGFAREARRRKVWVTAVAYGALTVGLVEIVGAVSSALLFPDWTQRLVTFLLILAFPVVMVLAWIFDIEAGGLRRTLPDGETAPGRTIGASSPRPSTSRGGDRAVAPARGGNGFAGAPPIPLPKAPARRTNAPVATPSGPAPPPDPDRVKRAALGHVRHELRTPINAILGYSEMLAEDETDADVTADLRRIHEAGRKLLQLVDGILDPERLSGSIERDIQSYAAQIEADLRTPINTVVGYAEMLVEEQREIGRDVLVPDLERILEAARTLLATSSDIVAVATHAPDGPAAAVSGRMQDSSDLARGVLEKIAAAGTGAEGTIEGRGSLLVVDDNPTNRDLLTRQLARNGYIVASASDGAEALEQLSARDFDLVLLDVIMPGMDGIETLRRIRQDERLGDIPVLMLSALDEVESAIRCIEAGAEEYIAKPVQPSLLQARIAANLEVRELRERERLYRSRIEADAETIERLLHSAVPADLADRVRRGEQGIVDPYPQAAVLYCQVDAVDPGMARRLPEYVALLSHWLGMFEALADRHGTDACLGRRHGFLAVARDDGSDGADADARIAALALSFLDDASRSDPDREARFRLGIHLGPVVAGVIGTHRLRYDLWGEAVETARSLASGAEPGQILVSPAASARLRGRFALEPGRVVEIRGLGQLRPSVLTGVSDTTDAAGAARPDFP